MRKITIEAVAAFTQKHSFSKGNTSVAVGQNVDGAYAYLALHNNVIAKLDERNDLYITNAGWATNTTKERLNALPNVSIQQRNFQWYLNGKEWNGEWAKI